MPRTNKYVSVHDEITSRIASLEATQKDIQQLLNSILIILQNKS